MIGSKILCICSQDVAVQIWGGFLTQTIFLYTAPGLFWDSCADGFVLVPSQSKIQDDPFYCCCHLFAGCGSNGGCRHSGREAGR